MTSATARPGVALWRGRLSALHEAATRRPGLLRNLLILAATIVVGAAAALWYISQEDLIFPWQRVSNYYAIFSDAASVAPGQHQEVRVAGVHVGDIGSATVNKNGLARVQLQITDRSVKLYQNATALLQAKTPLNEMYVELDPGTPAAPPLKAGGTIPLAQTQSPVELDQILQHLGPSQQNALRILLEQTAPALRDASNYLPGDLNAADTTLVKLQALSQALVTRQQEIRTLVTDLSQIATAVGGNQSRLAQLVDSAQTTLQTVANNDGALAQALSQLPSTTHSMGASLSAVQALTGKLNPVLENVRAAQAVLPSALTDLNATLGKLHPLLDQLTPVVTAATPVVTGLNGYLSDANPTLSAANRIAPLLDPLTAYAVYDMPWLKGFFYNTDSLGSMYVNGRQEVARAVPVAGASSLQGLLMEEGINVPLPGVTQTPSGTGGH